ncbi:hypothetical protein HY256_03205, partial [Candidatus Sumerlaeota bacterium]|nr:hypothetical protein [Candidatus Sumerlaeota bacterium]
MAHLSRGRRAGQADSGRHRILAYSEESIARLRVEKFDYLICLDKEPGPCAVAMGTAAENKLGIGLSRYGTPYPLNDDADYYFELGLNNEEKFRGNTRSYQHLMYEALGLRYEGERFEIELTDSDRAAAERVFAGFKEPGGKETQLRWVGINPGAGGVFAYKAWREQGYINLIRELHHRRPDV